MVNVMFKIKGIIRDEKPQKLDRIESVVNDWLYPMEYEGEKQFTQALIGEIQKLMAEYKITEEDAYDYMDSRYRDPDVCNTELAIKLMIEHARRYQKRIRTVKKSTPVQRTEPCVLPYVNHRWKAGKCIHCGKTRKEVKL